MQLSFLKTQPNDLIYFDTLHEFKLVFFVISA
jgi:hypothetical protein